MSIVSNIKILLSITALAFASVLTFAEEAIPPEPKPLIIEETFKNPNFQDIEPNIRIKDVTQIQGVRDNHLVGYGLVVGLNGTGDTLASSPQTQESLISMLERLGVNVRDGKMAGKNVAAVMVTATLPAFARTGGRIDVNVSAIGDAQSLQGGTLLVTPLLGADSNVYAVGQGPMNTGLSAQGANASQTKGIPTAGKISNGALIEKEVGYELADLKEIKMTLNTPDFTTAKRIAVAINTYAEQKGWGKNVARPLDMGTIQMVLPKNIKPFNFFHEIGHLQIQPDQKAKVLIDTQKDVIVVTSGVKMSPCGVASGSTVVKIVEIPEVYMPNLPNGGIMPVVNNVVGLNPTQLADFAKQTNATVQLQKEQLKALKDKQEKELKDFTDVNKETTIPDTASEAEKAWLTKENTRIANQTQQIMATQAQQVSQLNDYFQQQLQITQQQQQISNSAGNLQQINQATGNTPDKGILGGAKAFEPVITSQTKVNVREEKGRFNLLSSGPTLEKFVNALNQLGVSVKDMGSILMTIKNAGALHAEIIMN
ncbi:MAG: flagellar basal body P-ring protein FlgI [Alphaproteobacteria bacterium]|nr:flagellar basal body P-ring protein FlgI [Alphaproteobacteria bacterium]